MPILRTSVFLIALLPLAACSSNKTNSMGLAAGSAAIIPLESARVFPILDASTGERMDWAGFMDRIAEADVIILGEQHDDAGAHAVQLAVMRDVAARWPGSSLSVEMLERHEQALADDYVDGLIDQPTFEEQTFSSTWGGADGSWTAWYQPIIDAAKDGGGRVIAANAPRRYVRLAGREGYETLATLDDNRRSLFAYPDPIPEGSYKDRFFELMNEMPGHGGDDEDDDPEAKQERILSGFKSQLVWDATMAESIARGAPSNDKKIVHLIGQFHSDFEGGTVQLLRGHLPDANILTVSMQQVFSPELRAEDQRRADIVIYTK